MADIEQAAPFDLAEATDLRLPRDFSASHWTQIRIAALRDRMDKISDLQKFFLTRR
jgi:hypothetical protein